MITITDKSKCSGCYACENICPKNCIEMQTDKEGFWYPVIDKTKCIDCGLCEKACPILQGETSVRRESKAYAVKNKDEQIRKDSSSGGAFTEFASAIIKKGGVVFGAAFDESFKVTHQYAETVDDLQKFRGSKYVQSEIGNSYKQAKDFLESGRQVLFSGTPCQIGGLYTYLKKPYENLLTQDIICHGVPSPLVFEKWLNEKKKDEIKAVSFRDKELGWKNFSMRVDFYSGETYSKPLSEDTYLKAFLRNLCLRPSCYDCAYKTLERQSDITLADYWGVQYVHPEMDDDKGISLVLVHSKKGEELFDKCKKNFEFLQTDMEKAIKYNSAAIRSVRKPEGREKFIREIQKGNFTRTVKKYTETPLWRRVLSKIKRILKGEK